MPCKSVNFLELSVQEPSKCLYCQPAFIIYSTDIRGRFTLAGPCGLRGCKNKPRSVSWPDVIQGA